MRKTLTLLLGLALATPLAQAASEARWFRYIDANGQPVISDTVTPEHVIRGYDELTAKMTFIRKVPGQRPLTEAERAAQRAQREAAATQSRNDKQMLRLYTAPIDAERARNRQLDALQVRIDFTANLLATARQRRAAEAQRAATFERQGKPVPAEVRMGIAEIDRQISATQHELDTRKAEQVKIREEFEPIIRRLAELTGKPASTLPAPAPAPAAAPASP